MAALSVPRAAAANVSGAPQLLTFSRPALRQLQQRRQLEGVRVLEPGFFSSRRGAPRRAAAAPVTVAAAVVLGTRHFSSKGAAESFVKQKLRTLPFGRVDAAEEDWLRALLATHGESADKRGLAAPGAHAYFVKMAPARGGHCFGIVTAAGAKLDFSYRKSTLLAANANRPVAAHQQKLTKVMRCEVESQTARFRAAAFATPDSTVLCAVTRRRVRTEECHVDHNSDIPGNTFVELIARYRTHLLEASGIDLDALPLAPGEEGRVSFANADDGAAWRAWHAEHAVLRIICRTANLKAHGVGKQRLKAESQEQDDEQDGDL